VAFQHLMQGLTDSSRFSFAAPPPASPPLRRRRQDRLAAALGPPTLPLLGGPVSRRRRRRRPGRRFRFDQLGVLSTLRCQGTSCVTDGGTHVRRGAEGKPKVSATLSPQ
jgi:hypothetical protein